MKKIIIALFIFSLLAFVTNPSEDKHKEAVKRELDSRLEKGLGKVGELISSQWNIEGTSSSQGIRKFVKRENYYVFSKTKLSLLGEEKVIGYGFFGFVIIDTKVINK